MSLVAPEQDLSLRPAAYLDQSLTAPAIAPAEYDLDDHCGFDLHLSRGDWSAIAVEVKCRMRTGEVVLSHNERAKTRNLGERNRLYVLYYSATSHPRIVSVQNPSAKLISKGGGVVINPGQAYATAERE